MNGKRKPCLIPALALNICVSLAAHVSSPPVANAQAEAQASASAAAEAGSDCAKEPFTYDNGPLGQRYWCGACNLATSKLQAPINIDSKNARPDSSLPSISFSGYKTTKLVIYENVNNLKVDYKNGDSSIMIGKEKFKLMEFHFHRPGEEAIDNHRPAMVLHLVHANADASAFVAIAVLVEQGAPNPKTTAVVNKLIQHFPPPTGLQEVDINAADLLPEGSFPENHSYFRYAGSLTTPACGENVTFYVLKTPVRFSAEQIEQFERRYPFPNSRNIQNTNGRQVVQTTP
jgi:carbonic anhydrase